MLRLNVVEALHQELGVKLVSQPQQLWVERAALRLELRRLAQRAFSDGQKLALGLLQQVGTVDQIVDQLVAVSNESLPSGHATMSVAVLGSLVG